ncbi:MAG: hypothetical protein RL468_655 [Pseudomonadota bacterium]|jgi:hypothetical protein
MKNARLLQKKPESSALETITPTKTAQSLSTDKPRHQADKHVETPHSTKEAQEPIGLDGKYSNKSDFLANAISMDLRITPEEGRNIETAYRRGYHQGAYKALDQIFSGYSHPELSNWLNRVYEWRFKLIDTPECFLMTPPPEPCPRTKSGVTK